MLELGYNIKNMFILFERRFSMAYFYFNCRTPDLRLWYVPYTLWTYHSFLYQYTGTLGNQ
jgi:hypothetical protein